MRYFCTLQRRIYDILWQNIFATKTPKNTKINFRKQFYFVSLGLCGHFSGLSGLEIHHE